MEKYKSHLEIFPYKDVKKLQAKVNLWTTTKLLKKYTLHLDGKNILLQACVMCVGKGDKLMPP